MHKAHYLLIPAEFDHAYVEFGAVVVGDYSPAVGEREVVVVPINQAPARPLFLVIITSEGPVI